MRGSGREKRREGRREAKINEVENQYIMRGEDTEREGGGRGEERGEKIRSRGDETQRS